MAIIKIRRSTTAAAVPSSLVTGEIAINEADGALYYRDSASGTPTRLLGPQQSVSYSSQTTAQMAGRTVIVSTSSGNVTITLSGGSTLGTTIMFYNWGSNTLTLQYGLGPTYASKTVASSTLCMAVYVAGSNNWAFIT